MLSTSKSYCITCGKYYSVVESCGEILLVLEDLFLEEVLHILIHTVINRLRYESSAAAGIRSECFSAR
jgi:hypothetical protein